jgi:plasmid stability protein
MKAITLRNIPAEVQKAIRAKARQKRISVNKAVLELLQERVGILERPQKTPYGDLDELAGAWTAKEASSFETAVGAVRRIDAELWK